MTTIDSDIPFVLAGPDAPPSPVVISVPHAGRDYPAALQALARVPVARLQALEDRFADFLIDDAVMQGATAVVARHARAWIDLNRDPRDLDAGMIAPPPDAHRLMHSAKVRAGLGLVPRRLPVLGELWSRRLTAAELEARLSRTHEPYHRAVAAQLAKAKAVFGHAVLIDCHSMPPLPSDHGVPGARMVIGDRFGGSAADELVDGAIMTIAGYGIEAARNLPYAGGYTLDRHGAPRRGIHAIQIEFDRALYLDGNLDRISAGLVDCRRLLADIADRLAAILGRQASLPIAAE